MKNFIPAFIVAGFVLILLSIVVVTFWPRPIAGYPTNLPPPAWDKPPATETGFEITTEKCYRFIHYRNGAEKVDDMPCPR